MAYSREELVEELYRPVRNFFENANYTTDIDVNPRYITPTMFQLRLQKVMDEYVVGISTMYQTNEVMLNIAEKKLEMLRGDSLRMRARDLHELLRAWENRHRLLTAHARMKHVQFRKESRYPGYCYRTDFTEIDDEHWKCFTNSEYDRNTGEWTLKKVPYAMLVCHGVDEPEGCGRPGSPV